MEIIKNQQIRELGNNGHNRSKLIGDEFKYKLSLNVGPGLNAAAIAFQDRI